jgi:hypothetical protein
MTSRTRSPPSDSGRGAAPPTLAVFAAVLLLARAVAAQPETVPSTLPVAADHGLKIPAAIWAGAVAADQISTYRFSSGYGDLLRERNPLIRGLDGHPAWLVAAGTAIDAASGWAAYRMLGRGHPRLLKLAFYGAAAYRTYLAAYNIQMMQRAQEIRPAAVR